ncbi:hypothetical protein [Histidinibacterium aquaticum]|uniref:Lipoprotein n=1 Tax=Histidinibacterium aquaticum TaxID=2613962 RepID=A0A5J5GCR6_9RHOB|nr:hypothetical protein [Histidinibacterium aquaticum]KAA9005224.1 hypothetical protein F3S47_18135 [Histidinibacterium aquaticum]
MRAIVLLSCLLAAACTPTPPTPEEAAERCEARARAAQGPTGNVTVGVNSDDGPFTNATIGVTGDFLAGRDPVEVYRQCVYNLTGGEPYRPPRLRGQR